MFVKISNFSDAGITLPVDCRTPATNDECVLFAVVRWLSPHPDAILRDNEHRPICPPPFEFNHALWQYAKVIRQRNCFRGVVFRRQLNLFDGTDDNARLEYAHSLHSRAWYALIKPEALDYFINCTTIDIDDTTFLETITLPLNEY